MYLLTPYTPIVPISHRTSPHSSHVIRSNTSRRVFPDSMLRPQESFVLRTAPWYSLNAWIASLTLRNSQKSARSWSHYRKWQEGWLLRIFGRPRIVWNACQKRVWPLLLQDLLRHLPRQKHCDTLQRARLPHSHTCACVCVCVCVCVCKKERELVCKNSLLVNWTFVSTCEHICNFSNLIISCAETGSHPRCDTIYVPKIGTSDWKGQKGQLTVIPSECTGCRLDEVVAVFKCVRPDFGVGVVIFSH